jgi:predicted NBD/HSP70 family sugar kinase
MSFKSKKNQQLRADVIRHLFYKKLLSLTELSKLSGKSLPLITTMVNGLIAEGYVIEQGLAPSTGGRRPLVYLINPGLKKYVIAVAMDQFMTKLVIYTLAGDIILSDNQIELDLNNNRNATNDLISFIDLEIKRSKIDRKDIIGIGIGMPGFVNSKEGINYSFLPVAENTTLVKYLHNKLSIPVYIDNDSSLIALAELNFGKAFGKQNVLVVNIGWGTGLGMIIDGNLYRGSSGYAGEFSHIPLSNNDDLCSCGKNGCLEGDTSLLVMLNNVKKALNAGEKSSLRSKFKNHELLNVEHFLDAVCNHDPLALNIYSKAAFQIGKGISTLIHILNPELVVLSGRGSKAEKVLLLAIQQAINRYCIPRLAETAKIEVSKLGSSAELQSAAGLVVESSFY